VRPFAQLIQDVRREGVKSLVGDVTGPHHRGAQQTVECDVAVPGVASRSGQHEDNAEPKSCARGGGQPGVIALAGAAGDQRVRAPSQAAPQSHSSLRTLLPRHPIR